MSDSLFDIPESKPRWRELAEIHGIESDVISDVERMSDEAGGYYAERSKGFARIELFGEIESATGETEREAVISLIHRLKLTHWETVSMP